MYDEILEGGKKDQAMTNEFITLIHGFVLLNTEHMLPYIRYGSIHFIFINFNFYMCTPEVSSYCCSTQIGRRIY